VLYLGVKGSWAVLAHRLFDSSVELAGGDGHII
jgi:hypothetical protein